MNLHTLLTPPKTIAVVGISDDHTRPSHIVASYLRDRGFTIIPVNPKLTQWEGIKAYADISAIPRSMPFDIVNIFRKSEEVPAIVRSVINRGAAPVIWMQEGVASESAKLSALQHSLEVMMDTCLMKTHQSLQSATGSTATH